MSTKVQKSKSLIFLSFTCLSFSAFFLLACDIAEKVAASVEEATATFPDANALNAYIDNRQMPYAALRAKTPASDIGKKKELRQISSTTQKDYVCTVKRYKAAAEFNENILLDPTSDTFYPGALIKGETIENGQYISFAVDNRSPITISTSLEGISGTVKKTFTPTLSEFRQQKSEIENQEIEGTPSTRATYSIEEVTSREQLNLALGAGYNYDDGASTSASISGNFDFENMKAKSRFVVKFIQQYYTIDVDKKANAAAFFKDVTKARSNFTMMPLYVASVKYGRMIYFTYESTEESSAMSAALNAAFSYGPNSGNLNISASNKSMINSAKSKATIIGGSSVSGASAGVDGIKKIIDDGGSYSKDSRGAPIAYLLRSIKDGAVMKSLLASEYNVRNCTQATARFKLTLQRIYARHDDGAGSKAEIYGAVNLSEPTRPISTYAEFNQAGNSKVAWNRGRDSYIEVNESGGSISLNDIEQEYKFDINDVKNNTKAIIVALSLRERDNEGADDSLGSGYVRMTLRDITSTITRQLNVSGGSDGSGALYYQVAPIPPEGI